jgi:hypothetical protein
VCIDMCVYLCIYLCVLVMERAMTKISKMKFLLHGILKFNKGANHAND